MLDLTATLLILRLPETGVATYWQLVDQFSTASEALGQPLAKLKHWLKPAALQALAEYHADPQHSTIAILLASDLAYLQSQPGLRCITFDDPDYPQLLRHIPKPPPLLFVRGDMQCLNLPQIAIVGSRNPTAGGSENAERFAHYLAENGFAITSGMALGVDAAAHRGALGGKGKTIAVMGTGIDLIYPSRHRALAQQIIDGGGALVSEFLPGTASRASNFPQRNRIISGLSCGTLVVEAAVQSGSLITASYALQHNREVFAIPGSIHNPLARGCHQLIRQGATLVETAQDIVNELGGMLSFKARELLDDSPHKGAKKRGNYVARPSASDSRDVTGKPASIGEQALFDAMGYDPVTLEQLVERTELGVGEIAATMIGLEIKGLIHQAAGIYQRII